MDIDSLLNTLDTCGQLGLVLSTEESLTLYNSLLLLQNENHFRKAFFWGRIFGHEKDYYVAYGYTNDVLLNRVFYYSTNCRDWGLLPRPTDKALLLTPLCTSKFQGDPALVVDILIEKDEISIGEKLKAPQVRQLKEEDRLAAAIHLINEEAVVVPRGVLFQRPDGVVVENLSFEGLSYLEAMEVKSFLHYRKARNKWNTNLLTRNDYNYAIDFLDCADEDVPEGCFVTQISPGGIYVVVQSLYWTGFMLYHKIGTPIYGYAYFGNGRKCFNLPFMLQLL
ncbi:PREDICTED: radial spoke head protein 9 homolog [Nicrophorus vespilloides]|uniref:Radial spoke head protein 9 homolog n=1 Tax=Nicrophorus vespilloides TaxID=110193 RepID=A0ABM1NH91_NICVS|nr:PREDICTED: radial spoke head protein 9 homolog [Nicrophorus vespilloides]